MSTLFLLIVIHAITDAATYIDGTWNDNYRIHPTLGWVITDFNNNPINSTLTTALDTYHGPFYGDADSRTSDIEIFTMTQSFWCAYTASIYVEYFYGFACQETTDYTRLYINDELKVEYGAIRSSELQFIDSQLEDTVSSNCVDNWYKHQINASIANIPFGNTFKIQIDNGLNYINEASVINGFKIVCSPAQIPITAEPTTHPTAKSITNSPTPSPFSSPAGTPISDGVIYDASPCTFKRDTINGNDVGNCAVIGFNGWADDNWQNTPNWQMTDHSCIDFEVYSYGLLYVYEEIIFGWHNVTDLVDSVRSFITITHVLPSDDTSQQDVNVSFTQTSYLQYDGMAIQVVSSQLNDLLVSNIRMHIEWNYNSVDGDGVYPSYLQLIGSPRTLSIHPTSSPTTAYPTRQPSLSPTKAPTLPSISPTNAPSISPTFSPSLSPTSSPTFSAVCNFTTSVTSQCDFDLGDMMYCCSYLSATNEEINNLQNNKTYEQSYITREDTLHSVIKIKNVQTFMVLMNGMCVLIAITAMLLYKYRDYTIAHILSIDSNLWIFCSLIHLCLSLSSIGIIIENQLINQMSKIEQYNCYDDDAMKDDTQIYEILLFDGIGITADMIGLVIICYAVCMKRKDAKNSMLSARIIHSVLWLLIFVLTFFNFFSHVLPSHDSFVELNQNEKSLCYQATDSEMQQIEHYQVIIDALGVPFTIFGLFGITLCIAVCVKNDNRAQYEPPSEAAKKIEASKLRVASVASAYVYDGNKTVWMHKEMKEWTNEDIINWVRSNAFVSLVH